MPSPKGQVSGFIAKYSSPMAARLRAARSTVKALFPRGYELVYDNYNALAFGYSPSPKASDVVVSVVAYPKWVTLFFFHGAQLTDVKGVLGGTGVRIRSLRLDPISLLKSQPVQDLLQQALAQFADELAIAPPISTIIKSVSAKQRPRRPTERPAKKKAVTKRVVP